jgi:Fur family ferric uptake transcriptional regulator
VSSDVSRAGAALRLPRNYWTILQTIRDVGSGTHLTAQQVYELARKALPRLGFATVHRGLGRLHELGYVLKVDVPGAASAVYECAAAPHAHFLCTGCGSIDDIAFRVPQEMLVQLAEQHCVQIAAESTTFAGRCAACRAAWLATAAPGAEAP